MAGLGTAGLFYSWHGMARPGAAWLGMVGYGLARFGLVRHGGVRLGLNSFGRYWMLSCKAGIHLFQKTKFFPVLHSLYIGRHLSMAGFAKRLDFTWAEKERHPSIT